MTDLIISYVHSGYKLMGLLPNFAAKRPLVAEHDLAGVIVDQKESSLKVGEEVFGWIPVRESCCNAHEWR
jgi:NADPH:quinone reductase-like Zn-dependent oxidoreductase